MKDISKNLAEKHDTLRKNSIKWHTSAIIRPHYGGRIYFSWPVRPGGTPILKRRGWWSEIVKSP